MYYYKYSMGPLTRSDIPVQRKYQNLQYTKGIHTSLFPRAQFLNTFTQVLTPVQIALLSAASYPLLPDPTAMAEVALENINT